MPELPDVEVYINALRERVVGKELVGVRVASPFLVRSTDPPLTSCHRKTITELRRLGKRIVFGLGNELFMVLHLMIAGRLAWKDGRAKIPGRVGLAAFDFKEHTLLLREASKKKRASLYVVKGEAALAEHDRGGLEPLGLSLKHFAKAITETNHTVKRSLTDPRIFSGIGNAYSDEILHAARLSPLKWTQRLTEDELKRLHAATKKTLNEWVERLDAERAGGFPEKVTAFRPEMAVHGKHKEPCPVCGDPVQRIVFADRETNYCATCQTGGKLLADRALSKLLKQDWPKSIEELEALKAK